MEDSKALEILRTIAPEFKAVSDEEAQKFLDLCAPLVSKSRFGKLYDQALALLAAHRMKLAGYGISVIGGSSSEGGARLRLPACQCRRGQCERVIQHGQYQHRHRQLVCPDPLRPGVPEPPAAAHHAHHIGR